MRVKNGITIQCQEIYVKIIQSKAYSPSLKKLSQKDQIKYENNEILDFNFAKQVFKKQNFDDEFRRSRSNFDPPRKLGFVNTFNGFLKVTSSGEELIKKEEKVSENFLKRSIEMAIAKFYPIERL